jgi:glutathionylspermidine synthase
MADYIRAIQAMMSDSDMAAYLKHEAQQRGVTIEQVYREEVEAKAELARITPTNADLLKLAEQFPAPQEWYDE